MNKTFTQKDLIRFLYDETSSSENNQIDAILLVNDELKSDFLELKNSFDCLNKIRLGPSKVTVNNIISYAKALEVAPTKQIGLIDFVMN